MAKKPTVRLGTTFYYAIADSRPKWKVTRKVAKNAWEAQCQDSEDYGGTVKLFSTKEIQASKGMDDFWSDHQRKHEDFYSTLTVGDTVHYYDGKDHYVECEVVVQDEGEYAGKKALKQVAIKGNGWRDWQLPHRLADGTIRCDFNVEGVMKGKVFKPNASCILEWPQFGFKEIDAKKVAKMPRISLDVPPVTKKQEEVKKTLESLHVMSEGIEAARRKIFDENEDPEGIRQILLMNLKNEIRILEELQKS